MIFEKKKRIENRSLLDTFHNKRCVICNKFGCDPCHIKSKGSGGDDIKDNLIALCRPCHTTQHAKGHKYMWDNYLSYKKALQDKGWVVDSNGKLKKR